MPSFNEWLPLDSIQVLAVRAAQKSIGTDPVKIDRMDIRPSLGVVKVTFEGSFLEVQVDGSNGDILFVGQRYSDFIEKIHDGSILDVWFSPGGQIFKLTYTTLLSFSLMTLCLTGLGMWYYPKVIRRLKNKEHEG
ncbi:MAG: hypothetical protein IPN79_04835 [Saprospiraceae bacterium]|nr:hypothetical protein [Saprospiraceae bacterium]